MWFRIYMITQVNPTNIYIITDYCSYCYVSLNRMASRPKRTASQTSYNSKQQYNTCNATKYWHWKHDPIMHGTNSSQHRTFRQYMENFHTQQRKTANRIHRCSTSNSLRPSTVPAIISNSIRRDNIHRYYYSIIANNITPSSGSVSLTLGIDDKVRAKIHAGDYIKFSSLLQSNLTTENDKYNSVEKDGQLLFLKSNE